MDATVLVAQKNGMYQNREMCKDCIRKKPLMMSSFNEIEIFIQVKQKKLKNSVYENYLTVISFGHNKIL